MKLFLFDIYKCVCLPMYVCRLNVLLITGPFSGIGNFFSYFFSHISTLYGKYNTWITYEDKCAHSGTNCGRSHTSIQQQQHLSNVHYSTLKWITWMATLQQHHYHLPPPPTEYVPLNWEIEYREKQFETRCAFAYVPMYFPFNICVNSNCIIP